MGGCIVRGSGMMRLCIDRERVLIVIGIGGVFKC